MRADTVITKVSANATDYLVDGSTIIAEKTGNNTIWYYYDAAGCRIGFTYNSTPYYYIYNAQGDVVGLYNSGQQIVARYNYDAWGKCEISSVSTNATIANINPYRYRGYYYDKEIGMYYLQSRYYNTTVGRFVNGDSVEFAVALFEYDNNLYTYCNNAPVYDIDSDGFKSYKTKNKNINKILSKIEKYIPNIYSSDFKSKEKTIFKIGTKNLSLTFSVGASVQSNKNALFGAMHYYTLSRNLNDNGDEVEDEDEKNYISYNRYTNISEPRYYDNLRDSMGKGQVIKVYFLSER